MSFNTDTNLPSERITFTNSAASKVYSLICEEKNPNLMLRVFIKGGGCSGFTYGFTFDEERTEDDMVIEKEVEQGQPTDSKTAKPKVKVLIDATCFPYLDGAEIHYKEDINGAQFIIKNPNAKGTCGCGSSFSA